ncbi:MAG: hypothetical protein R3B93_11320 [Bacteroidia bacterium]
MSQYLINRREQAMDRADRALDAAHDRKGLNFVREMQSVVKELGEIAEAMQQAGTSEFEQSRTYSYLGSVYSDLAPASGKHLLLKAKEAYEQAERLLKDSDDMLAHAKLNFNFANTLRQIDPNNIEQLQEAKLRLLAAKKVFEVQAPQYMQKLLQALESVNNLLKIAPIAKEMQQSVTSVEALEKELEAGGNPMEIMKRFKEITQRGGGIAGLVGRIKAIESQFSDEIKQNQKYAEYQKNMNALIQMSLRGEPLDTQEATYLELLQQRIDSDLKDGKVNKDRAETLNHILSQLGTIFSGNNNSIEGLMEQVQELHQNMEKNFDLLRDLSHSIPRPPIGSRAAELKEFSWVLRRFLIEEMSRPNKGPAESKKLLELNIQAVKVDKRIYEAGADDEFAKLVEKDEFRPFVQSVRAFSARSYSMLATPIWPVSRSSIQSQKVYYSGSVERKNMVANACGKLGLSLFETSSGQHVANTRWKQIQSAITTVFDLGLNEGPELSAITYELGIALTLGKPIVILATPENPPPFDVDLEALILAGNSKEEEKLVAAIDRSIIWLHEHMRTNHTFPTLDYIL